MHRALALIVLISIALTGCAKKESNFEQAGREMDSALSDMSRELNAK